MNTKVMGCAKAYQRIAVPKTVAVHDRKADLKILR